MGEVPVSEDCLWGAQTQRSFDNFNIGKGRENMPLEIVYALSELKKACAAVNFRLCPSKLTEEKKNAIIMAADGILSGAYDAQFPLVVWQTGSGTQTNMNVNEVIAHIGNGFLGGNVLHPNDDVNMSQSSNDTFPSAMHIAAVSLLEDSVIPALDGLIDSFSALETRYPDVIKCGRTHLQDATPLRFSHEVSGWRSSLEKDREMILAAVLPLKSLAIGGTAVGTGINAPEGFGDAVAQELTVNTGKNFVSSDNKFHSLSSKDEIVFAHGALKALACDLMKIANDVRWLSSGPRNGLGEIRIPENEPGSSIMPGKVNPTQCEAVTMVAAQVMGNDVTVGIAASQGNFELNVYMPVCAYNFIQSAKLLSEVMNSFNKNCVSGISVNAERMDDSLKKSLMLATALSPYLGYEKTAEIARSAYLNGTSLKEECVGRGLLTEEDFNRIVDPEKMV